MSEDYEREKVGAAVRALAASAEPIQKRLEYAWLSMHTLITHGFIDSDRASEFESINARLTADKSDDGEGWLATTCSKLTDEEAVEIAQAIVDLNTALHHNRIYALEDELAATKR